MTPKRSRDKRQAKILVADNDPAIAVTLGAILEQQGYVVATVFSGEEAVAIAEVFSPDLLVSDVYMSGMNGVEAAARITAKLPECRVLFLSGVASMSDVLKAAPKRLVYSFTSKPLHSLDLLNAIAYMLSAVSTLNDSAGTAAEDHITHRNAMGRTPAKAGFVLKKSGTGSSASLAAPGRPDVVFFNMRLPDTAGLETQLH